MRIYVSIYKDGSDCTNNGLSSKHDRALLVWNEDKPNIETDLPIFYLKKGYGHRKFMAIPEEPSKKWFMFGGNFLYSSDSNFPSNSPIHIHDRV